MKAGIARQKTPTVVRRRQDATLSISCSLEDRARIDRRAASLGLDRSTYIIALARQDCARHPDSELAMVPDLKLAHANETNPQ